MRITPLPNSLNPADYTDPSAVALAAAIERFEELFDEYFVPGDDDNSGYCKDSKENDCKKNDCLLEFFYYYDPQLGHISTYKNAIWIRINHDDRRWLYVKISDSNRKKVSITTINNLQCPQFPQVLSGCIKLPPNFVGPFAFYEKKNVAYINYRQLVVDIILRLPCVCHYKTSSHGFKF